MKILLKFSAEMQKHPHIADVILETKTRMNIVRATADTRGGEVVIDVPEVESEKVIQEFLKRGVDASKLEHPIVVDESLCIECGACISICSPKVFSFSDWKISVDKSKCIQCGLCIPACPLGALKLP